MSNETGLPLLSALTVQPALVRFRLVTFVLLFTRLEVIGSLTGYVARRLTSFKAVTATFRTLVTRRLADHSHLWMCCGRGVRA